jgi:hypothetical protein
MQNNQTGRKSMISDSQDLAKDKAALDISKVRIVLLEKVTDICLMKEEEVLEWEKQKREWMVENNETGNLI